jgi:hypothetical protein
MKTQMHILGEYVAKKYRTRMRAHLSKFNTASPGVGNTVAQQLRKQGYSLDMALLILLGARERGAALRGLGAESVNAAIQREAMQRHHEQSLNNAWNCMGVIQNTLGAGFMAALGGPYPPPRSRRWTDQ